MVSISIQKRKKKGHLYYYAVEVARVEGKPRIVWQRYLGSAKRILETYELFDSLELALKTYDFGGIAAMLAVADDLGFSDIVTAITGDEEAW